MNFKNRNLLLFLFVVPGLSSAGPYTAAKDKACPEPWGLTDKAIGVIWSSTSIPWEVPESPPGGPAVTENEDKSLAKTHLSKTQPVQTIDKSPVTDDDLVNDPLTVASECLTYRNFEVDSWRHDSIKPTPVNTENGWMRVVIF